MNTPAFFLGGNIHPAQLISTSGFISVRLCSFPQVCFTRGLAIGLERKCTCEGWSSNVGSDRTAQQL